jgi:cytoskeletal protein CcmA (bactofilin family)
MKRLILIFGVLSAGCSDGSRIPTDTADSNGPAGTEGGQAGVDENFNCVGAATGTFANVFVPAGRTCHLSRSTVSGNVLAREGSRLFVSDTRVQGNIDGVEARVVQVRGGSLGGSIQIQEGSSPGEVGASVTGGTVLSQGNITIQKMTTGTIRIADVVLRKGNIQVQENSVDSRLELVGNRVAQNLQVFVNRGGGAKTVRGNTVGQTLECKENTRPFTGGPNRAGEAKEQCF